MRDCRVCGTSMSVPGMRGPATCPTCRREKYLVVKRRYQQTPKGIETARARETREDVRELRRQFSRSQYGKRNKAKYDATDKGKATRKKALLKHRASPQGKQAAVAHHLKTKDQPARRAQRQKANAKYKRTAKGKALSHSQYARRKGAVLATEKRLTAAEWLEIVTAHKSLCHYCQKQVKLTLDHVIPLSKGGQHTKDNVVPACQPCNSKKRDKLILAA